MEENMLGTMFLFRYTYVINSFCSLACSLSIALAYFVLFVSAVCFFCLCTHSHSAFCLLNAPLFCRYGGPSVSL